MYLYRFWCDKQRDGSALPVEIAANSQEEAFVLLHDLQFGRKYEGYVTAEITVIKSPDGIILYDKYGEIK